MISHHHKCIFVYIPRTAGQSVEHFFLDLLGLDWRSRAPLLLRPNDIPELGPPRLAHLKVMEYVRYRYITKEQFSQYFKFSFVRDPWDRLVSIYKHLNMHHVCDFRTFVMKKLKDGMYRADGAADTPGERPALEPAQLSLRPPRIPRRVVLRGIGARS